MTLYKVIYIIQVFIKAFFIKHFVQNIMRNQTYYSWKHKATDPVIFNKAPSTHNNSSWSE
jgi:hypothetical protein